MSASVELLLRLLDHHGVPLATPEDFDGAQGESLRVSRDLGLFGIESGVNPVSSCPHCGEGVPFRLANQMICNTCRGEVEDRDLEAWELDQEAFLRWLSQGLKLCGEVRRIDDRLWQLGTLTTTTGLRECFYRHPGPLAKPGLARVEAYRDVLVFHGVDRPNTLENAPWPSLSLLAALDATRGLSVRDVDSLIRGGGAVRFDAHSGALWAGEERLGEVPVGSREYHFLECLGARLDHFVPYADIQRHVLAQSGSADATEEATFCQSLKSRIKKKWIPAIDRYIVTTNKADGYRLRAALSST